jgi:hypothetical protein
MKLLKSVVGNLVCNNLKNLIVGIVLCFTVTYVSASELMTCKVHQINDILDNSHPVLASTTIQLPTDPHRDIQFDLPNINIKGFSAYGGYENNAVFLNIAVTDDMFPLCGAHNLKLSRVPEESAKIICKIRDKDQSRLLLFGCFLHNEISRNPPHQH